ncbi:CD3337/EF1877 family mobilome membrane protein [Enterococcus sp. DIV0086]|uniref:CD3337/EF1877 family mobilome membrane protein n=1 Tax=Enterococcus sp. DIV0086 TaxID=2774655 RepID=UPI003D2A3BA7
MLLKDLFDIDSFQSFFEKGGWFSINENLQSVLNALLNIAFGLIKYLVLALDYVIDKLFSLNLLEGVLPDLFSTTGAIYNKLFSVVGILLFTFVIVISVKDFFEKGISKALIRFGIFTLIYVGSMTFFADGANKVQEVNTLSQNVQGQLVDLTSGSLTKNTGNISENLLGSNQQLDGTSNIRNLIFDEFVIKPYALLNFGKTDVTKEQFESYLVKSGETFDQKKTDEIADKIKKDSEKNSYLTSDRMTEKVAVLLNTFIMLIVIGTAVLIIGVANILIQLLIYGILFLFPSLLFLALIPNMHHLLKNGFMLLGTLFASKIGIGFGFGLLFSILNLLDSFFVVTNIVTMIVGLFVKVLLGLFIWKNKGQIVRSLTKGKAALKDFSFNPKQAIQERQQQRAQKEDQQNRYAEQDYKTQTAENDYLRSGIELDHAYRQNELQDNLLVQAGEEETSLHQTTMPFDKQSMESKEEPLPTDTFDVNDSKESFNYPVENTPGSVSNTEPLLTETALPTEEVDDNLLNPNALTEETEIPVESIIETSNVKDDSSETEPHLPSPVTEQEAQQLEKEISHLRQETYTTPEFSEEQAYENA